MGTYRKRYQRCPSGQLQLTEDDLAILRAVYHHRFLNSNHIRNILANRSGIAVTRRLRKLTDFGYLDRPPQQQLHHHYVKGSLPLVYALGDKGASILEADDGISKSSLRWQAKNRDVKQLHLEHTLRTVDTLLAFKVACKAQGYSYLDAQDMVKQAPRSLQRPKDPFRNQISHFVGREKVYLPLRPDGIFAFSKHQGSATLCLLETDRATMPVNAPRPLKKQSFIRSSIYKKLVAYWRALETEQFKNHYGVNAILILFVTTSQARIQEMQAVLSDAKGAAGAKKSEGHFLFGCQNAMCAETIFSYLWLRGDGQYKALL